MNATIVIQNLKCGGCANTVKNKLSEIEGLQDIEVVVETGLVKFQYNDLSVLDMAKRKLKSVGYPEVDTENSLITKAKSYISCATGKMSNKLKHE